MSLVRLLGFTTLGCGCVTGRYREIATNREMTYVEEKGTTCSHHGHRRNHTIVAPARFGAHTLAAKASWQFELGAQSAAQIPPGRVTLTPDAPRDGSRRGFRSRTPRLPPRAEPCGSTSATASTCSVLPRWTRLRDRHVAALQPRRPLPQLRRHAAARPTTSTGPGAWIGAAAAVLDPAGSLFLNVGAKPTDPWTRWTWRRRRAPHLQLQNTIHWIKSIAIDRTPPARRRRSTATSPSATTSRSTASASSTTATSSSSTSRRGGRTPLDRRAIGVQYQDESNVARWQAGASNLRCRGNTWFIPYETIQSRDKDRPHPATFPPRVPEYCLRLHGLSRIGARRWTRSWASAAPPSPPPSSALDFIGVEIDEHYLDRVHRAHTPGTQGEGVGTQSARVPRVPRIPSGKSARCLVRKCQIA